MPPIDPAVVRVRANAIADLFDEAEECATAIRRLLSDYADRVHRLSPRLRSNEVLRTYKTPAPVLRAVVVALTPIAHESPAAAMAVVNAIWEGGSLEERRIAAELLGSLTPQAAEYVVALVESWLPSLDSKESAEALAEFGLAPLLVDDPFTYQAQLLRWAQGPKWTAVLSASVVSALAKERRWDDVPSGLEILRYLMTHSDPYVRQAVSEALVRLSAKNSAEVTRFLLEVAALPNPHSHQIIRQLLRSLPADSQAELARAMRL